MHPIISREELIDYGRPAECDYCLIVPHQGVICIHLNCTRMIYSYYNPVGRRLSSQKFKLY